MISRDEHTRFLQQAARLALRGHGGAEPNPMVGCVIVADSGTVVGWGHHRRCGGPHAEIAALRRAGDASRGATVYLTLEPCNHTGRTAPCTLALIEAGVRRVVIARPDPNPQAAGGADRLRAAGIEVVAHDGCTAARRVSDPFAYRVRTGLPWVIAKWAQTVDGRLATRSGESQWISGAKSRRLVHRERGRVDAILTGIGTVLADDPQLTARDVRRRRLARRIIVDPDLRTPPEADVVRTAGRVPTTIACRSDAESRACDVAGTLVARGAEVLGLDADGSELPLDDLLREIVSRHDVTTVLVEGGPGLLGRLFRDRLVCMAWVFVGPLLLGDEKALPVVRGLEVPRLAGATRMTLDAVHRRGEDLMMLYRVDQRSP